METSKLNDAIKMLRSFWDSSLVYNVDVKGKNFNAKEKIVSNKPSVQDALDAITSLTKVVKDGFAEAKADRELIKKDIVNIKKDIVDIKKDIVDIKNDIVRLDAKIDNIVNLNNLKT